MSTIRKTSVLAVALFMAISGQVNAQRSATTQIEEVVVTAQKREENMQDVPISMSAMDESAIEKAFARDLLDVAGMSPNFVIEPILGSGTAAIAIRGIMVADVEKSYDPAVAVYLDGVYQATTTGLLLNTWDPERIEILRGPQGTLFGRNTIGGLVSLTRTKPTGELGGKVNLMVAEDGQMDIRGLINLPEWNGISMKLSAMSIDGGGYFRNVVRGTDEGDTDIKAWSVSALWEPNDDISLQITYDDIDDTTPTRPVTCMSQPGELFYNLGAVFGYDPEADGCTNFRDPEFHEQTFTSFDQPSSNQHKAITINASYQINDNHRVAVVYGTREIDENVRQEFDGQTFHHFLTDRPTFLEQESFEIRLESDFERVRTTFGAYYWEHDYEMWQNTFFALLGGYANSQSPYNVLETENQAFFGQIEFDVTNSLSVSVGGRYLEEDKHYCQASTFIRDDGPFVGFLGNNKIIASAWGGKACPDFVRPYIDNNYLDSRADPQVHNGDASWSKFTPAVNVKYTGDFGMVYASWSEGFRSGSYNGRATDPATAGPYDPEKVTNIEVGFKTMWADNTFQLNGSVFTMDYDDKQQQIVRPPENPNAATLTVVETAGSASIDGVELEAIWIPTAGLTITANLGYLDAGYDEFDAFGAFGNPIDKSVLDIPGAPEMTYAIGANYEISMGNSDVIVLTANYRWRDDWSKNGNNYGQDHLPYGSLSRIEAQGFLDASINYESENWRLSFFGKNLTDERYLMHYLDVNGNYCLTGSPGCPDTSPGISYMQGAWSFGTYNRPRYFGAELQLKF